MTIAYHLKKSKQEAQQSMTSSEFVEWKVFIEQVLPNLFDPMHHYLAQIALDVERANQGLKWSYRKKRSIKDKLLSFVLQKKQPAEGLELSGDRSKTTWLSWLGITPKTHPNYKKAE